MKYYVFIETGVKHTCPYFDTLEEAMELYKETEMTKFRDNVFLGISSDNVTPTEGYCFDVLRKFFDKNILINGYLNHDDIPEIMETVKQITRMFDIRYQLTCDILDGALIDYKSVFARIVKNNECKGKWNEIFVAKLQDKEFVNAGWVEFEKHNQLEEFSWNWPNSCAYVSFMNVTIVDNCGHPHMCDVDPRDYLLALGKKISLPEERNDDNENT